MADDQTQPLSDSEQAQQDIPGFVHDNAEMFQDYGKMMPVWRDVKDKLTAANPDYHPDEIKQAYSQQWNLWAARRVATHMEEKPGFEFMRKWLPWAGAAQETANAYNYGQSKQRFEAGNPTDDDYQRIALYEAQQQRDVQKEQAAQEAGVTSGQFWLNQAQHVAPMLGEQAMLPLPGGGGLLGMAGRAAGGAALTPSMYVKNVIQDNNQAGRDPLDPRGLPGPLAQAIAQNAVWEGASSLTGRIAPGLQGPGVSRMLGRTALSGVETPFIQQGADLVSHFAGLQTGYGTGQELLEGKYGDAGKHVAAQILTGALMHAVHEGKGLTEGKARLNEVADSLKEQQSKGYTLIDGIQHYHPAGPHPGLEESPTAPGHTADGGIEPIIGPNGQDEFGRPAQPPAPEAPGAPPAAPEAPQVPTPTPAAPEAPQAAPEPQAARQRADDLEQQHLDVTKKLTQARRAETQEKANQGMGLNNDAPGATLARKALEKQQAGLQRQLDQARVQAAEEATRGQGIKPAEHYEPGGAGHLEPYNVPEEAPQRPAQPASRAEIPARQTWNHAGTKFTDTPQGQTEFAANGKTYRVAGSLGHSPSTGKPYLDVSAIDPATGDEHGRLLLDQHQQEELGPGEYAAAGLNVHTSLRGKEQTATRRAIVNGMYDFASEQLAELKGQGHPDGGNIVSSNLQSDGGKAVWARNASLKAGEEGPPPEPGPLPGASYEAPKPTAAKPSLAERVLSKGMKAPEQSGASAEGWSRDEWSRMLRRLATEGMSINRAAEVGKGPLGSREEAAANRGQAMKEVDQEIAQRRAALEALDKNHGLITHEPEVSDAVKRDAKSVGVEPEALRREIASELQAGAEQTRTDAANAPEAGAPAGEPGAGPAAEAGGNAPAGSNLTPQERMRRGQKIPKQYEAQAVEQGIKPDDLHTAALHNMAEEKAAVDDHNQMLREAWRALKEFGVTPLSLARHEDAAKLKGIDEVAEEAYRNYPSRFDPGREDPTDTLFRYLSEGMRKPAGAKPAYEQALEQLAHIKGLADETQEARDEGHSPAEIAEAVRAGTQDGQDDARDEAGPPHAPGDEAGAENLGAADFDFGANEPSPAARNAISGAVNDFLADQRGSLDINRLGDVAGEYGRQLRAGYDRFRDWFDKLGGAIAPMTTRLSRPAGDTVARFDSARQGLGAAFQAPLMTEQVLGKGATPEQAKLAGAYVTERRLRYMKQAYLDQSRQASNAAAKARAAGDTKGASYEAQRATEMQNAAREVVSTIGWQGNPLQSFQDYKDAGASPYIQGVLQRWRDPNNGMVPLMEANFRKAMGLEDTDPINDFTQIPGEPMNLMRADPDSDTAAYAPGVGRGNLRAPKLGALGFARQAKGNAEAYELDLGKIIQNSISKGNFAAAKADMYRTFNSEGVGMPVHADFNAEGWKVFRDVIPASKTQGENASYLGIPLQEGQTAFAVRQEAAGEFRQVLQADQPSTVPEAVKRATGLLNWASLASAVEPMTHMKNQMTMLMTRPGMSPVDALNNAFGVMTKSPEVMGRLAELAKIDALAQPGAEYQGKILPASAQIGGVKLDPTHYLSKIVETTGLAMRLTADDAFNRLARSGLVVADETNRRNFVNQLGNYSKGTQNQLVALLRDTGIGPFATAGTANNVLGIRSVLLDPGVEATSPAAAARLRATMLGRTAAFLAAGAVMNFLAWGRIDGDDKTPLGSIKLGTDQNGKTHYLPVANWMGLDRGMKAMGAYAFAEGARTGRPVEHSADKATEDAAMEWLHPAMGPGYQFAHTVLTGKNTIDVPVSKTATPGHSQEWENFKAATANANPIIGAATGRNRPAMQQTRPLGMAEVAEAATGPFVRARKTAPGKDTVLIRR